MWDKCRYYDRSNSNLLRVCRKTAVSTEIRHSKLLASFFDCYRYSNSHTNHGVIAGTNQAHHLCASAQFPIFQHIIALYPSLGTHILFRALHCKNPFNEHIVFSFDRCIISRFDAFANRLFDKFTKCLQLVFCLDFLFHFPTIELRLFVYDSSFHIIRI